MKFIVQSVSVAVIFVLLYSGLISIKTEDWGGILPEHQYSANLIRAQDFLLTPEKNEVVVLGTSLSVRLNLAQSGVADLSLAGMDVSTGLEILRRSGHKPAMLFVESNLLGGTVDRDFVSRLYHPPLLYSRQWVPAFRERNRPTRIIAGYWQSISMKLQAGNNNAVEAKQQVVRLFEPIEKELTDQEIRSLTETLDALAALEERGVRVILFELPMSPEACNATNFQARRDLIRQRTTTNTLLECRDGITSDGLHLNSRVAGDAARALMALPMEVRRT